MAQWQQLLLTTSLAAFSLNAVASTGEELFISKCACCHFDEASLRIGASKIKKIVTGDSVKQHRFSLSDEEVDLIISYLDQDKS